MSAGDARRLKCGSEKQYLWCEWSQCVAQSELWACGRRVPRGMAGKERVGWRMMLYQAKHETLHMNEWTMDNNHCVPCVRICVCACACLEGRRQCECWWWRSKMRGEVLIIVPTDMQSIDWRQFEEWQKHRCKCLRACGCVGMCVCLCDLGCSICEFRAWRKAQTHTPFERAKSSLCFCFLQRQNTPPKKSDHFVSNTTWSHSSHCGSQIKLQHQKEEAREPFLPFLPFLPCLPSYSTYCTMTATGLF